MPPQRCHFSGPFTEAKGRGSPGSPVTAGLQGLRASAGSRGPIPTPSSEDVRKEASASCGGGGRITALGRWGEGSGSRGKDGVHPQRHPLLTHRAVVEKYLLEKSRLVSQEKDER